MSYTNLQWRSLLSNLNFGRSFHWERKMSVSLFLKRLTDINADPISLSYIFPSLLCVQLELLIIHFYNAFDLFGSSNLV